MSAHRSLSALSGCGAPLAIGLALTVSAHQARAAETADDLLRDPNRLEVVQQGCKTNQPWATDALCREAAQAIRRRFQGGGVPYTPKKVEPFPNPHPLTPSPSASPSPPKPEARRRQTRVAHAVPHRAS